MATRSEHTSDDDAFLRDLEQAASGDKAARDRLWDNNYDMLRDCVRAWLDQHWRKDAISLGGTDIVNVAYQRLHDRTAALEKGRAWFFKCFYTECLRISVDHWKKTKNDKGRGQKGRVELNSQLLGGHGVDTDPSIIFDILEELERRDPRTGRVAMLKVFETRPDEKDPGAMRGLTNQEVADLLECGLRTVEKDWAFGKSFLLMKLSEH